MKRFALITLFLLFAMNMHGQFKAGINGGIPSGDYADYYSFSFGVDLYYLFGEPDALLNIGANAAFLNYVGEELGSGASNIEIEAAQFIPLAAVARLNLLNFITLGPDVGYALGLNDGNDGGFYWRGVVGLIFVNTIEIDLFYHSVSFESIPYTESKPLGSIGIGLLYEFNN